MQVQNGINNVHSIWEVSNTICALAQLSSAERYWAASLLLVTSLSCHFKKNNLCVQLFTELFAEISFGYLK